MNNDFEFAGYVGDLPQEFPQGQVNYVQTYPWYTWTYPTKSAREQVQDEILAKMAEAIEADDIEKARELVKLAKALKEL